MKFNFSLTNVASCSDIGGSGGGGGTFSDSNGGLIDMGDVWCGDGGGKDLIK